MSLDTRMPGQKMVDAIRRRDKGSHPHHRVHPVGSPGLDWPSFWCGECAVWDRRQLLLLLDAAPRAATEPPPELREAAKRLCDAIADQAAIRGLGLGWKAEMDADDAQLCALQDTRTALDGRERPHVHKVATSTSAPEPGS